MIILIHIIKKVNWKSYSYICVEFDTDESKHLVAPDKKKGGKKNRIITRKSSKLQVVHATEVKRQHAGGVGVSGSGRGSAGFPPGSFSGRPPSPRR